MRFRLSKTFGFDSRIDFINFYSIGLLIFLRTAVYRLSILFLADNFRFCRIDFIFFDDELSDALGAYRAA